MENKSIIRHATWLELFYDLIFVIVIAKITHVLAKLGSSDHGYIYYFKYLLMFLPVWWAWIGHTLYNNRFDIADNWQKVLTIFQLFAIIMLSFFIGPDFEKYYLGFTFSYVTIRYLLILMYWRSYYLHHHVKEVSKYFMIGFFIGTSISLSSVLFTGITKYIILYAGILFDFLIPIIGKKKIQSVAVDSHHLPERLGLMTIILLGESILSITNSLNVISSDWEARIVILLGYVLILGVFWLYFSFIEKDIQGIPMKHGQSLIYGHLPLYLSLGLIANLIYFSIPGHPIDNTVFSILVLSSMTLLLVSLQLIRISYLKHEPALRTLFFLVLKIGVLVAILSIGLPKIIVLTTCILLLLATYGLHHRSRKKLRLAVKH